jgi:hypothetical protein
MSAGVVHMDDQDLDATNDGARVTRRRLIRGGAVIAGLGAVGVVAPQQAQAADGQNLVLGQANTAESPTTLAVSDAGPGLAVGSEGVGVLGTTGSPVFDPNDPDFVRSGVYGLAGEGVGVVGRSESQIGVLGTTGSQAFDPNDFPPAASAGVYGLAGQGVGVAGRSTSQIGVLGTTGSQAFDPNDAPPAAAAGVYGLAGQGVGVAGRSTSQIGVLGTTGSQAFDPNDAPPAAAGVYGLSTDAGMPGVLAAQHGGGVGLKVEGRTVLSTAGRGTILKGASSRTVNHSSVQSNSVVLVTLNGGAGGAVLRFVQVANGSFTVRLSESASKALPFSFLVLN